MTRVVYVNGRYLPYGQAAVHAEDRGFQFADAIYEVCEVKGGALVDETRHLARLERSLGELKIRPPMTRRALGLVMRETIRRNRVQDGLLYLQVTRGAGTARLSVSRPRCRADTRLPGPVIGRRRVSKNALTPASPSSPSRTFVGAARTSKP